MNKNYRDPFETDAILRGIFPDNAECLQDKPTYTCRGILKASRSHTYPDRAFFSCEKHIEDFYKNDLTYQWTERRKDLTISGECYG